MREYQIKKSDAERRLKNSRINLDKTRALIEEILPHLRSLKRQTGRWERRSELAEELKALERQFFGSHLSELAMRRRAIEETVTKSRKQFEALEKELRAAEERQAAVEGGQPEEKKMLAKIKDEVQSLMERRSNLQKDLGRLEAQVEMAQQAPRASAKSVDVSEKLMDLIRKVKAELTRALDEDEMELRALIEGLIEEIDLTVEEKGERKSGTVPVPDGLKQELRKMTESLAELEKELAALHAKEKAIEENQEGFYKKFKSAVGDVQLAKNRIAEWESRNREQLLEVERLDLRREELLRQIEQAGRKEEEFRNGADHGPRDDGDGTDAAQLADIERRMFRLRGDLASIGEIDEALMKEAKDTESRHAFLAKESEDLEKAVADLASLMRELTEKIKTEFDKSLGKINDEFEKFFGLMFGGGTAKLKVLKVNKIPEGEGGEAEVGTGDGEDAEAEVMDEEDGGIEIDVKLPRKKITSLDVLSGGERSLVGIAALFAMVSVSPPPFLILDEIDAPLDERNARRFSDMLKEFSKRTQFVVVTHNRATMEAADILYGVTLAEDGTSKVVSMKFEE